MPTYYDKETGISFVYGRRDDPQKIFKQLQKQRKKAENDLNTEKSVNKESGQKTHIWPESKAAGGKFTGNIGDVRESESQDSHFKGQKYQGKK